VSLSALRDDALTRTPDGFALRVGLPWIRSLPLASLSDLEVAVDGTPVRGIRLRIGDRLVTDTADVAGWWYVQDRLVVEGDRPLDEGPHEVAVSFRLAVPYLQAGPDGPLELPFRTERTLTADAAAGAFAGRDVA